MRRFRILCLSVTAFVCIPAFGVAETDPLTLDQGVREALARNPSIEAAEFRWAAARAAIGEARSAWYPQLALSAGYHRTDNPPQAFMMILNQGRLDMTDPAFDPNRPEDTGNLNLTATARYLLYDGGVRSRSVRMAARSAALAEARRDAVRNALAFEVVRAWYGVLQSQAFVALREVTIESIEALHAAARERFDAGATVRTDVLNLDTRLAEAQEQRIRAVNALELAVSALNTAIGTDWLTPGRLPLEAAMPEVAPVAEPAPEAYRDRPEWRSAQLAVALAQTSLEQARGDRLPRVLAVGSLQRDGETLTDGVGSYAAGVVAEWEAFGGFRQTSAIRRALAEFQAAEAEGDAVRQRLGLELRQAALAARDAWQRLDVSARGEISATEALRVTRDRYRAGAVEVTELLMAQSAETAARTRVLTARYDYCVALANLRRAQGIPLYEGE